MLRINTKAPDFKLQNQNNEEVQLSSLLKSGPVVVYFYPKDETPGCTAEACAFRDAYEDFTDANIKVVGISADGVEAHQKFAKKFNLPFDLLADTTKKVAKLYDVKKTLGFIPGRVTYVIDENQIIIHAFDSLLNATKHVKEALTKIKK
jgi:peroxiredoxin Q/BCP